MALSLLNIEEIARETQAEMANGKAPHDILVSLYLAQFGEEYSEGLICHGSIRALSMFPAHNCKQASPYLNYRLGNIGQLGEGTYSAGGTLRGHWVISLGRTAIAEKTILDITAHQFPGGPDFYLGELTFPWAISRYHHPASLPATLHTHKP